MRVMLMLALLVFSGCGSLIPNPPSVAIKCPPLVAYSQLQQEVLGAELPKDGPESQSQIEDYVKLRQACRAAPLP